jgi:hypothetical protein
MTRVEAFDPEAFAGNPVVLKAMKDGDSPLLPSLAPISSGDSGTGSDRNG